MRGREGDDNDADAIGVSGGAIEQLGAMMLFCTYE